MKSSLEKKMIQEFSLPSYVRGKTFAEASKAIDKKFEERNDIHSKETKKELMERLSQAQEYIKMQESLKANSQEVPDQMNGQVPEGMNQMYAGGLMADTSGLANEAAANGQGSVMSGQELNQGMSKGMGSMSGIAGAAGSALEFGNQMFGDTGIDDSGLAGRQEKTNVGMGAASGAVKGLSAGAAFGPIGMAAGAVVGGAAGLIGGNRANKDIHEGNMNASLIQNNKHSNDFARGGMLPDPTDKDKLTKDVNEAAGVNFTSDKANSLFERVPGAAAVNAPSLNFGKYGDVGYFKMGNTKGDTLRIQNTKANPHNPSTIKPVMDELRQLNPGKNIELDYNSYALGGNLNTDPTDPKKNTSSVEEQKALLASKQYAGYPTPSLDGEIQSRMAPKPGINYNPNTPEHMSMAPKTLSTPGYNPSKQFSGNLPSGFKVGMQNTGEWLGNNYGELLRGAPVVSNALQLANLDKPDKESLDRIDSRYKTNYVDERALENRIQNEANNTTRGLANASNGSAGALRSNLLGSQLQKTNALSDAYLKSTDINRQEDRAAQRFNAQNDRFNISQSNREKELNARNEAAYDNNKSMLQSNLASDIGNIGREATDRKTIAKMYGYDVQGNYVVDKQGNKISWREFQQIRKNQDKEKNKDE